MNNKVYLKEVKKIKKNIYGTPFDKIQNLGLLGTYSLVSANILKFLNINVDDHYKLIQDIQFHRSLSNIDQYFTHKLDELKVRDYTDVFNSKSSKGNVFVTFHTGSYRLFIQYLNKKGLPFCLVTEGKYIKQQGEETQKLFKNLNAEGKNLEILEAENPRLLLELIKRINSGISVVFYIDGNTGVTEKKISENKNLLKIDFLNANIYARQGIAMLAYLTKAPIVFALAKRNKDLTNSLKIKKVNTEKYENFKRNDFVNNVTKSLFYELDFFLKKHPEQWEGWFYIQKFFEEETHITEKSNTFINRNPSKNNIILGIDQHIQLVKYDDENVFVITKRDYQIMKVTPLLFDVLTHFKTPKSIITNTDILINDLTIEWNFVEELIEMNFLSA